VKIKNQLKFKDKEKEITLLTQLTDIDITEEEIKNPVTQMALVDWEEENIIKKHITVSRKILTEEEWAEEGP